MVMDMWLNSRALTKRQASEGTDKDLEKQHEIKKLNFELTIQISSGIVNKLFDRVAG